jgi:hypothetical protein
MGSDLERKLKAGYVNKERVTQVMHRDGATATARLEELETARREVEALQRAEQQGLA